MVASRFRPERRFSTYLRVTTEVSTTPSAKELRFAWKRSKAGNYTVRNGNARKSTFPPLKIRPIFAGLPSARGANCKFDAPPAFSNGARTIDDDGSTTIFIRSQISRIAK
jgi:hypothetical protein